MSVAPSPAPAVPRRVIVAITVALAIGFACLTGPYYLFNADPARYVALARSLANGDGYRYFGQPELFFPPGLPLVLMPAALLREESFATTARWAAMLGALVFPAAYAFARTRTAALPIALLTIFSAGFLDIIIGNPRSEPTYMVCSLGLIAWAHHGASRPRRSPGWASYVAAGAAFMLMSVATRSIGVAAVGAVAMVMVEWVARPATRSRFPSELVVPFCAGVGFLVFWFAWTQWAPNPGSYPSRRGTYLQRLLELDPHRPDLGGVSLVPFLVRILRNLITQLSHAAELLTQLPWIKPRWFSPFTVAILALTTAGLWAELRRPSRLGAWYFLGYGAILLFWPYDEGTRFLVPILPFLWIFAIVGARQMMAATSARSRPVRRGLILLGSVCLLGATVSLLRMPAEFSRQDQAFALVWVLIVGVAVFGWDRAAAWIGAMSGRFGRATLIGALALYAAAGMARTVPQVVAQYRGSGFADPAAEALREASGWISGNTRPDASIQATIPAPIQFATGRRTVEFPSSSAPEQLRWYVEVHRPDFLVVLNDSDHPYHQPVDSEKLAIVQTLYPGALREVVRLRGSTIYAFH